ncbi:hypothetical protein [Vibrio cyclitrophicus]|uniref:hypothetical protein n=1 Tax=Vibrio cyclitrophicus TaxID=47951 RepID=UPI00036F5C98|nr:hypothetical protein [Vibrio cyclitrophicus]KNH12778.1 hypothetical protein ACS79_10960 [Vibrio lentus]KAA8597439.1 hypothetical protein F0Z19_4127 [Vibrio cyclitrophicus]OEE84807.1 hypothetical protein OAI_20225 [Vibrio cyclitrophicus FF160]OEF36925.1 hypothetical protein OA7_02430 [Vibrio cyclitrophicus 1F53]OEF46613.1 hypothetical protein OAC_06055 [Vibrio cyclitrophicus 1F273]
MDIELAFSTVLAAAGSVAAVGFIAKLFANTLATAAIKKYELVNARSLEEERKSNQKEIELIRSQLSKLQKEHEVVFSSIYAKREQIVTHLYCLMSEFTMLADDKLRDPSVDINAKHTELANYFDSNRLYFSREVAIEITQVMSTTYGLRELQSGEQYRKLAHKLKIQVYDHMEILFRDLLKIEEHQ